MFSFELFSKTFIRKRLNLALIPLKKSLRQEWNRTCSSCRTLTLLKFTRQKRIAPDRTAIHAEANNGECFTVRYSSNSCLREFSNKVPQYLTTRFCMQTFSEFPCQHKIEATSSLFLEHHHQSETIKTNWPASVWKCKQREYVSFPNYYSWFSLFGSILISTLLFAGSHMCAYIDDWRVSSIIHEVQPIW